jgi:hypothetical protein
MPKRQPNEKPCPLLDEADWTYGQLASAVNRTGTERGLRLTYDESSVKHWLDGTMPRKNVRPVVIEALARRTGRPVTLEEAGLGSSTTVTGSDVATGEHDLNTIGSGSHRKGRHGPISPHGPDHRALLGHAGGTALR